MVRTITKSNVDPEDTLRLSTHSHIYGLELPPFTRVKSNSKLFPPSIEYKCPLQIAPPTMFSSSKIFTVCIAVVAFSSGVHAEKEVAQTLGLVHHHGLGVGVGGVGVGVGGVGVGVGGVNVGVGAPNYVGGVNVGVGAPNYVGTSYPVGTSTGTADASTGAAGAATGTAGASASATANASANAGAGTGATYRKLRSAA